MGGRKLWKVMSAVSYYRPESKAAAYRYVESEAANYLCNPEARPSVLSVYVDERDGQGWRVYEDIDLRAWCRE